jgi:hypothetical protein
VAPRLALHKLDFAIPHADMLLVEIQRLYVGGRVESTHVRSAELDAPCRYGDVEFHSCTDYSMDKFPYISTHYICMNLRTPNPILHWD